ncbi:expressed unknown protein [Seminavis robusta]|uniref:Uncharacterized protein n=1 Tax=Seminavis robusta TaxID=568900 RepID=A0A9N8HQL0_9STRA|nr:expressed unknown protein [Seminavis robusta]|eukprot:Sro995_g229160.1 n/a (654) ;mRNA; f:16107-18068
MPPVKRKTEDGDTSNRPKKMSKEERAAAKERAKQAMLAQQEQQATSQKKTAAASVAVAELPPPKNKKEQLAQAREKARLAMQQQPPPQEPPQPNDDNDTEATPRRISPRRDNNNNTTSASQKKPPPKVTTTVKKAAPKVTISSDALPDKKPAAAEVMPLPTLARTQSTPLELALEEQVAANVQAVLQGKPPPFTSAPPDHLLKFAPTELEEGYDHNEHNARDIDEEEDAETQDTPKQDLLLSESVADAVTSAVIHTPATPVVSNWVSQLLWTLFLLGVAKIVVYNHARTYHRAFHKVMAVLPVPNPYRTVDGTPIPYMPCFDTNTNNNNDSREMRPECIAYNVKTPCPAMGQCWGGQLHQCSHSNYLQVAQDQTSCIMKPDVAHVYHHVLDTIASWALEYHCQKELDSTSSGSVAKAPVPHMVSPLRGEPTHTRKQPMFHVAEVLTDKEDDSMDVNALWALLEAGNPVAGYPLKLKVFESYDPAHEQNVPSPLVAVVPSKQYVNKLFPLRTQCRYRQAARQYALVSKTPWLLTLWVGCVVALVAWIALTGYYWRAAQEQQELLASIEVVRHFVIETLQTSEPQTWKGMELKRHVLLKSGIIGTSGHSQALFHKRIWPRVVFDIRGNPNIYKSVIVSNGDLIDIWQWQPRELTE